MSTKTYLLCALLSIPALAGAQYSTDFIQKVPFSRNKSSDQPADLHVRDFNKDGHMDIVADGGLFMNQSGYIKHTSKPVFFINDGKNNFVPTATSFTHASNSSMISDFADYNKDGWLDMLVYDFWANGLRVYKGSAGLNFTLEKTLPTGTHGSKAYFEDMDDDGDLDIINVSSGSLAIVMLHIFENTGGNFRQTSYADAANKSFAPFLWAKDMNRDGRKDVVYLTGMMFSGVESVKIWIQNPDKTYTLSTESLHDRMNVRNNSRFGFTWSDLNNDNLEDLIFLNDLENGLTLTEESNINAAYASPTPPYIGSRYDITSLVKGLFGKPDMVMLNGDIDNDGVTDLVTCNRIITNDSDNVISVITDPFNKRGRFMLQNLNLGSTNINPSGHGLLLADLDADKDLELISLGLDDTLRIFGNRIGSAAGIAGQQDINTALTICPNPATDHIRLQSGTLTAREMAAVVLSDMSGRTVKQWDAPVWNQDINISGLPSGTYLLKVQLRQGDTYGKLLIKQ